MYQIYEWFKYAIKPKWELEKTHTGGRLFLTFKQAQDFKKELNKNETSFKYKVEREQKNQCYIDFLNKEKNFTRDRKEFLTYEAAQKWALKNLEKFNPDMINYF